MSKTWTVLKHELRQALRRKAFIITTVGLPVILLLGYLAYQGVQEWYDPGPDEGIEIGYVDEAGGFDAYERQYNITFVPFPGKLEAGEALLDGSIEEYFVIPADYLSGGRISRYIAKNEIEIPGNTWRGIERFLLSNLLAAELSPDLLERAMVPMSLNTIQLDESGAQTADQDELSKFVTPFVFAILFMIAIFFSSGSLLSSVTEEKENRVMEIVLSSVSPRQLLAGKVIGLGIAGLLQIVVWLASIKVFAEVASVNIPALSDLSVSTSLVLLGIAYFVLGYLFFAAMYACIGSIGSTAREGQSLAFIVVMPATMPLYLNFLIVANPESTFAKVLTFFPVTAGITAMMRLSRDAMAAWEIVLSLAILAGAVVVTMWVAAKVFRVFLLMYGKRPALREIVRHVREA